MLLCDTRRLEMQREMHRTTGWKVQGTQCLHLGRTTLPAFMVEEKGRELWGRTSQAPGGQATSDTSGHMHNAGSLIQPHLFYRKCVATVTTYIMLHSSLTASAGHCCLVCWPWVPVSSLSLLRRHQKVHKERSSPELSITSLTT